MSRTFSERKNKRRHLNRKTESNNAKMLNCVLTVGRPDQNGESSFVSSFVATISLFEYLQLLREAQFTGLFFLLSLPSATLPHHSVTTPLTWLSRPGPTLYHHHYHHHLCLTFTPSSNFVSNDLE